MTKLTCLGSSADVAYVQHMCFAFLVMSCFDCLFLPSTHIRYTRHKSHNPQKVKRIYNITYNKQFIGLHTTE